MEEEFSERELRALENIILSLKVKDYDAFKEILESEFEDENKRARVLSYLSQLGFEIPNHLLQKKGKRELNVARYDAGKTYWGTERKQLPSVRRIVRTAPQAGLTPLGLGNKRFEHPIEREITRKEYDLVFGNVTKYVYEFAKSAESEILIASPSLHPKLINLLKRKSLEGVSVKVVLDSYDCRTQERLGFLKGRCKLNAALKLAAKFSLLLYNIYALNAFNYYPFATLLGSAIGISDEMVLILSLLSLFTLQNPSIYYAGIGSAATTALTVSLLRDLFKRLRRRGKNSIVLRMQEEIPFSIAIVDRSKAFVSDVPFDGKRESFAKFYRSSVDEALKEFYLIWESAVAV